MGKTSLVTAVAKAAGFHLTRINLSEQTVGEEFTCSIFYVVDVILIIILSRCNNSSRYRNIITEWFNINRLRLKEVKYSTFISDDL